MVKKKFTQKLFIKKNILNIFFSLLIAFLITLILDKLQKKEYSDVNLNFVIDRDVRMELSLLPTSTYKTNLEGILLSDNLKLEDLIMSDIKIKENCSLANIKNEIFINLKMSENGLDLDFIANDSIDINKCIFEINNLLNSMVTYYFKNLISHKQKTIEIMEKMQKEFELSGSLATEIIDLETIKKLVSNKDFFTNNHKIIGKSGINSSLTFISIFISFLFLLNLPFLSTLLKIKKK